MVMFDLVLLVVFFCCFEMMVVRDFSVVCKAWQVGVMFGFGGCWILAMSPDAGEASK